jgi:signal peptidase II
MTGNTKAEKNTPPAAAKAIYNLSSHVRLWSVAILGLTADIASKTWAVNTLGWPEKPQPIVIIQDYLRFFIAFNDGAVAGVASGKTLLLIAVSIAALVFLFWMFSVSRSDQKIYHIAMGMLIGGALGNLYDRLFNNGYVVDFIEVDLHFRPANPWPTFNIADMLLCVGVGIMLISILRHKEGFKL